jgi:hypothetical protein
MSKKDTKNLMRHSLKAYKIEMTPNWYDRNRIVRVTSWPPEGNLHDDQHRVLNQVQVGKTIRLVSPPQP